VVTALAPSGWRIENLAGYATCLASELAPVCRGRLSAGLDRLGWVELRMQSLAARDGRQDALLCPRASGGFVIVVDPELSPADRAAGRDWQNALDWRLAHELGHTYFYDRAAPPQRWCSWCTDEEDAADFFAAAFLRELSLLD